LPHMISIHGRPWPRWGFSCSHCSTQATYVKSWDRIDGETR
jgi:hypothetical protein